MAGVIHYSNMINILDTKNGINDHITVSDFFTKNALSIEKDKNGNDTIITEGVKVQENTGWTDLLSITKVNSDISYTIIMIADKSIIVSDDYPVPIYDTNKTSIGFHGEVKYDVKMKPAFELSKDDILRLYRAHDCNMNKIEFGEITLVLPGVCKDTPGYMIKTRSGLINVNDIVLYTHDVKI